MTMIARKLDDTPPPIPLLPARSDMLDGLGRVRPPGAHPGLLAAANESEAERAPCTRILVADDHEVVRCGLRTVLERRAGWKVVAEAGDGKSAIAKAVETKPHVAIIDDLLPLMNGIEVTRQIRARCPATEVLVFATYESEPLLREIVRSGGRAYLRKSDAAHDLIAAVEALVRHKIFFTGNFSQALIETYLSIIEADSASPLSPRERVVVQLIAEGYSNRQISSVLNLSIKTVETHRGSAMRKMNVSSTAGLVRYAVRNALVEA